MFPKYTALPGTQRGSILVIALVVSVFLLLLGLALSQIIRAGVKDNALEFYGAQAYFAAQSGVEASLQQVFGGAANCAELSPPAHFAAPGLTHCTVQTHCDQVQDVRDSTAPTARVSVWQIKSEARCTAGELQTERRVLVEVKTVSVP